MPPHSLRLFNKIRAVMASSFGKPFIQHPWHTFHVNFCVYILKSPIVWVLQDRDWGKKSITVELQVSFMQEGGHKAAAKQR